MSYKKYTAQAPANKNSIPAKPATTPSVSRQEFDKALKELTHIVEKDPKKAAEVFKSWLEKPSKIVKDKKAA